MFIFVIVLWILCACLSVKIESIMVGQPTFVWDRILIALFVWPFVVPFILTTKHYVGLQDAFGKRLEGVYPDSWRY